MSLCNEAVANIKRGATLSWLGSYTSAGLPVDLTNFTLTSQVRRTSGTLVADLVVEKVIPATLGQFRLKATTAAWPVGRLRCDIRFADSLSGAVVYTSTFVIDCSESITQ